MTLRFDVGVLVLASCSLVSAQTTQGSAGPKEQPKRKLALYVLEHQVSTSYRPLAGEASPLSPEDEEAFLREVASQERWVRRRVEDEPDGRYLGARVKRRWDVGTKERPYVQTYTRREVKRSMTFGARLRRYAASLAKQHADSRIPWVRRKAADVIARSGEDDEVTETPMGRHTAQLQTAFLGPDQGRVTIRSGGVTTHRAITPEVAGKIAKRIDGPVALVLQVGKDRTWPIYVTRDELARLVQPGAQPTRLESLLRAVARDAKPGQAPTLSLHDGGAARFAGSELATIPLPSFPEHRAYTSFTDAEVRAEIDARAQRAFPPRIPADATPARDGLRQRLEALGD